jgi:membrane-associated protease RseP (regulator of RpoE activity)
MSDIVRDPDSFGLLRPTVAQVMDIQDVTMGRNEKFTVRFRGTLKIDSQEAYAQVESGFRDRNFTPLFRIEEGQHVILALPGVIDPRPINPQINIILFLLTAFSVFYTGAFYEIGNTSAATDLGQLMLQSLLKIYVGWPFAVSLLAILLAHEFGHYFLARYHKSPATLPFFLPLPAPISLFGTLGAVIVAQKPFRNKRVQLDIGIAGPLAGFIVCIPVIIIGLLRSHVGPITLPEGGGVMLEGNSVVYLLAKFIVFGKLLPAPVDYGTTGAVLYWLRYFFTSTPLPVGGTDVMLDQVAWAGWAGLLITGLNLIPAGQLDGGHAIAVLLGAKARRLVPFILVIMVGLGFFWNGWWLWAAIIYFLNNRTAELLDEITPLDPSRKLIAIGMLVLFVLVFTPVPLAVIGGSGF